MYCGRRKKLSAISRPEDGDVAGDRLEAGFKKWGLGSALVSTGGPTSLPEERAGRRRGRALDPRRSRRKTLKGDPPERVKLT